MSKTLIENCEFAFKCPLLWESLSETEDEKIRFCGECKRNVYICENDEELTKHAQRGDCVAVIKEQRLVYGGLEEVDYSNLK
ncbi:hypothetical protein [Candidatus Mycalebacterium sp.]